MNGAIEAMVKPLAREPHPLRVNAVSPGVLGPRMILAVRLPSL